MSAPTGTPAPAGVTTPVRHPVTAVIACYSDARIPLLDAAVSSVVDQAERVVVVVDHNEQLLSRLVGRWPGVSVVPSTGSPGASGARNTGAATATTALVAFLDDDAVASSAWLESIVSLFEDPSVIGVGGAVEASWAGRGTAPAWFPAEFAWVVGASYAGQATTTAPVRNVWAENMVVRASAFRSAGGFPDGFGKVASRSRPEDTAVCLRMSAATPGGTWLLHPPARVVHHVPASRQTLAFFVRRCFSEGAGKAELARLTGPEATADESDFVRRTVPRAVAREARDAMVTRSWAAAGRAAAVLLGTACAAAGYGTGRVLGVLPARSAA